MHDLVVTGTCGTRLVRMLKPRAVPWQVTLDLTRMTFCEPIGLVGIAALAERATSEGERVVVRRPVDPSVANYLARMRLGHVLASLGAEHDLPWVNEHAVGDALLELTAFDGARGAGALAAHVHQIVEMISAEAAAALHSGICEAGQNVAHHSGRTRGFVAAQRTYSGGRLHFAVGDSGVGLLATLRDRGARDDEDALELALRPGVTRTPDPSRGNGLADMVDQVSQLDGWLEVASGTASVVAWGDRGRFSVFRAALFPGTLVQGVVAASGAQSTGPRF